MSDKKLFLPILLGTNRQGRQSEPVAKWLHGKMEARVDIETRLFDTRDFDLPMDDYGTEIAKNFPEWRDAIIKADGLILVVPEYNHSFPGIMKSVIDLLLKEYIHKSVALVGVSASPFGGARGIQSCLPVVRELGLVVTSTDLYFPQVQNVFDESGNLLDEAFNKRAVDFLDELVFMSSALRWGRENLASKHHQ